MSRSKEEIWHMVKYVLDIDDELEIASWTKALLDLKEIQSKYGYPTAAILEIDDEVFNTTSMAIYPNKIHITTNENERYFETNKIEPDVRIIGDVSINECSAPLHVHGNVFCKDLNVSGDFKPEKFINCGVVNIVCENFNSDDITISGEINISTKTFICSEIKANKILLNGNLEKCTFLNSDNLTVTGDVFSTFINGKNDDKIQAEINKHFDPKQSAKDFPNGIYGEE
jgi:hypothetical protein